MQFLGDIGGFQQSLAMLGFVANAILLASNPAAVIYENLYRTAPESKKRRDKKKVVPKSIEEKDNWLRSTKKPKISIFEHLRLGNFILNALLLVFRSDK